MCVYLEGKRAGIAWADVSTGEFFVMEPDASTFYAQIARISPMEVICNDVTALKGMVGEEVHTMSGQPQGWFQPK